jgi:hypothetical protein
VNSYIIAKAKGVCDRQKEYTLDWIQALNRRAQFMDLQSTRRATVDFVSPNKASGPKRTRMSSTNPQLPAYRFQGDPEHHAPYVGKEQRACTYCKYLFAIAKKDGVNPLPEVARPSRRCFLCNVAYILNYFIVVKKTVDTLRIRSIKVVVVIDVITCCYYCYCCA